MFCARTAGRRRRPGAAVKARRVIGTVAMNGDKQDVKGPGVAFHRACFAEERGLWVEIT
jgi:hypothetical protein